MKQLISIFIILNVQYSIFNIQLKAQLPLSRSQITFGSTGSDAGYDVQQTAFGGYIVAGRTNSFGAGGEDVYLINMNAFGDTLWTKTFGGDSTDIANSVRQTADGGFIIAGETNSFGAGYNDVYLLRTDANGDTLWTKAFGGDTIDIASSVQQTLDGGYIIAGWTYSFGAGDADVYLIKTDSAGDALWTKIYGGTGDDQGHSVQQTADSGYIITGHTNSFGAGGYDAFLIKTNSTGDTLWTKTFGNTLNDECYTVQQTTDGGYIAAGWSNSSGAGGYDVYLIKTDSAGASLWTKTYGGTNDDYGYSARQTAGVGYIITGNTLSFGTGLSDVYLIKTDSIGDTLWSKTYGGTNGEGGYAVKQTTDGGYAIAGYTNSFPLLAKRVTISTSGNTFVPDSVTITEGDTVCFQGISGLHPLIFTSDSSTQYTSNTCFVLPAGIHDFFCANHWPLGMTGSINVQPAVPNNDVYFIRTDANGNSGGCFEYPAATVITAPLTIVSSTATLTGTGAIEGSTASIVNSTPTEIHNLAISIIINRTNVTCNGLCDGTAAVTVKNGTPPYNYSWNTSQSTPSITGLCPGTYIITVTDTLGCSVTDSTIITEPDSIILSLSLDSNVSCNGGSDGGATVSILSGGISPYDYLWSGGDTTINSFLTFNSITAQAGIYTVTVVNADGCSETDSVTITEPAPLTFNIVKQNVSCNGVCDGTATANPTGGTPPYTYIWVNGDTNQTADSLCAGNYTVCVTDANGCDTCSSVTITEPLPLVSSITDSTNISCFGFCNGTATVTPSGGTPPYTYLWNDPLNQTDSVAVGLCPGNYQVAVIDNNGCLNISGVLLTEPPMLTSAITDSSNITCGFCDGSATLTTSGGTLPYTYFWADGQTDSTATGLCAGTISVIVTDANGCTDTSSVTLTQPGGLTSGISASTDASCNGFCNGTAVVSASGGTPGYTYAWIDVSVSDTVPGKTDSIIDSLCAGNYMAVVRDNNGCITTAPLTIAEPPPIPVSVAVTSDYNGEDISCNGACDGSATLTTSGGTPPYTYLWSNGDTGQVADSLCAIIYNVTVTDSNGCVSNAAVTVTAPPPLPASVAVTSNHNGADISCNGASDGEATVFPAGGVEPYTYLWDDDSAQTDSVATGLAAGTYNITVTDANGCNTAASVIVTEPQVLVLVTQSVPDTAGNKAGKAWVTVTGGTPDTLTNEYGYQWNTPPPNTNDTIFNLFAGTYTVIVTDANGCVDTADVTVGEFTGIKNLTGFQNLEGLIVYPNPNTGKFVIEFNIKNVQNIELKLLTADGRIVYHENLKEFKGSIHIEIDMNNYAKGIYDLQVLTDRGMYAKKVIYQ